MISVHRAGLSFTHDGTRLPVLQDISFSLHRNSRCAIIGPSGCGKTSLLFLLAGLLVPDSGAITIAGTPRIGTILQHYGLFPWKTVSENIALGLTLQRRATNEISRRVATLVDDMGLKGFEDHFPGQLSGGMQQRVALARTLALDPDLLLMDEPLSSLDALTRERLQDLILRVQQTTGLTTVVVTHAIEEAVFLGSTILVLSSRPGRIVQVVANPNSGSVDFRQSNHFFDQCRTLRMILNDTAHEPSP